MQASEDHAAGEDRAEDTVSESGVPGSAERSDSAGAVGAAPQRLEEEGAVAPEHPQNEGNIQAQGQGGDGSASASTSASAKDSGRDMMTFVLTVPFQYAAHAQVARRYLAPVAESLPRGVYRELSVSDSDLIIVLTAEDPTLLEHCMDSLLRRLTKMLQTLNGLMYPLRYTPQLEKIWEKI
ncbi:PREDICTED: EKC/KEOPS complex subunit LAGE3-like [Chinchilla lanigera]|uniref:EKC/KEOPS complex subunit LAGE3-like n=1 Tax=Chinchilla lanigera TaxID=34839 RepID=UPI00038EE01D|nr:PREDICTED: EKC/KEOPS complex subunit LAGE3-like [Chinchilla lanigera]